MGAPMELHPIVWTVVSLMFVPGSAAETLDWAECVAAARASHPAIRAARESVRSAEAAVKSSRATYLPDVDGAASYNRTHGGSSKDDYSYGVSASQRIHPGLVDRPEVAQARARLGSAQADLAAVNASVKFDLKSAFAEQVFAQDNLALAETIAARRARNLALVRARFDAGREHKGSHQRAVAQSDQAEFDVRQSKRAIKVARQKLLRAMGRDTSPAIFVRGGAAPPAAPPSGDIRTLAEVAPPVMKARADHEAAAAGLTIARREFSPTVTASASADRNGGSWPPRSTSGDWNGKVAMSIPLFKGGKEVHDVRAAESDLAGAEADLKNTREQTVLDLEDRRAALSDAIENVAVRRAFLDAAALRAEIAQAQYTSGLLSFDDWDIIENDLIAQQKSALASMRDAVVSEARWELTLGKGFGE